MISYISAVHQLRLIGRDYVLDARRH